MDQQTFRQAILLLSGENSVAILRALRDGGWHLSSEVARSLHIHITTASKFLQRFADLGLVDRLRELVAAAHRDPWSVCAQGLGAGTAKGVVQAALRDAIGAHPDLALRCGLTRALEG